MNFLNNETNQNKIVNTTKNVYLQLKVVRSCDRIKAFSLSLYLIKRNLKLSTKCSSEFYNDNKKTKFKNNLCGIITDII